MEIHGGALSKKSSLSNKKFLLISFEIIGTMLPMLIMCVVSASLSMMFTGNRRTEGFYFLSKSLCTDIHYIFLKTQKTLQIIFLSKLSPRSRFE